MTRHWPIRLVLRCSIAASTTGGQPRQREVAAISGVGRATHRSEATIGVAAGDRLDPGLQCRADESVAPCNLAAAVQRRLKSAFCCRHQTEAINRRDCGKSR
jgi:hypothetical protein